MKHKTIKKKLAFFNFFQITTVADLEYNGEIYKDVNNRNMVTLENWEQNKETFFTQRMATYKDSYTLEVKIKLELSRIEKLPINEIDYQILKDRYKAHLEQKKHITDET